DQRDAAAFADPAPDHAAHVVGPNREIYAAVDGCHNLSLEHDLIRKPVPTFRHHALAQHGDEAVQRLGRGVLVLNQHAAHVAFAGVVAVGAVAREIVAGNDAQAAFAPQLFGRG